KGWAGGRSGSRCVSCEKKQGSASDARVGGAGCTVGAGGTSEGNGTKRRCGLGCGSWQPSARDSAIGDCTFSCDGKTEDGTLRWRVNHKRVYRLYREEGLAMQRRRRKRFRAEARV